MATFTTQILDHLETGSPLSAEQHNAIDFDNVRRILLRDNVWHFVYRPEQKDREALVETMAHVRRKAFQLCRNKSDAEIFADPTLREMIPLRQRPERLAAKPFRTTVIQGERWAMWPEAQDPIPALMQVVAPWREVMALEVA